MKFYHSKFVHKLDKDSAKCNLSGKVIGIAGGSTKGLHTHNKTHPAENQKFEKLKESTSASVKRKLNGNVEQDNLKQPKIAKFQESYSKFEPSHPTQKAFDEAMIDFLSESFVSFNVTSSDSYENLMKIANRRLTVKERRT